MNLLVHYPSRGRPALFRDTLSLYLRDSTARLLISLDSDDPTMNCPSMLTFLAAQDRVDYRVGNCKSKVDAVNDGLYEADWDVCMIGSDDFLPVRADYAQRIVSLFDEFFPDRDGVLHLDDGRNGKILNSLAILGRPYFDRFGYVYRSNTDFPNDGYVSTHCDNELQEVSEKLGRAIYVHEIVVRHEWIGGTHPSDKLHLHNESFYERDARMFKRRQAAGFPA